MLAPVHPDDALFRIEHNMPRYHSKDLCPQHFQQIRPTAQSAFVRQKYLQPFPCNRRGSSSTATDEPHQIHHAALLPNIRFIKPLHSTGTVIVTVSPIRRRIASV